MQAIDHIEAQRRFKHIPTAVQDAMTSEDTANTIGKIAQRYGLNDVGTSILADEVGWIMLGAKPLQEMPQSLEQQLSINPDVANTIAQEIDRGILSPIHEHLEQIYQEFNVGENQNTEGVDMSTRSQEELPEKPSDLSSRHSYANVRDSSREEVGSGRLESSTTVPQATQQLAPTRMQGDGGSFLLQANQLSPVHTQAHTIALANKGMFFGYGKVSPKNRVLAERIRREVGGVNITVMLRDYLQKM